MAHKWMGRILWLGVACLACDAVGMRDVSDGWLKAYQCFGYLEEPDTPLQPSRRLQDIEFTLSAADVAAEFVLVEPTLKSWNMVCDLLQEDNYTHGTNGPHFFGQCTKTILVPAADPQIRHLTRSISDHLPTPSPAPTNKQSYSKNRTRALQDDSSRSSDELVEDEGLVQKVIEAYRPLKKPRTEVPQAAVEIPIPSKSAAQPSRPKRGKEPDLQSLAHLFATPPIYLAALDPTVSLNIISLPHILIVYFRDPGRCIR